MSISANELKNDERFSGESILLFIWYLPFGFCLVILRICLALILWICSIILPNKSTISHILSTLACWTFGVYVKLNGERDARSSVLVANYVSCLDSLAAAHVLHTISLRKWKVPPFFAATLGIRNAAQFVRKQHFVDSLSRPVLLQPEGGPTNGKGLLKFTDWPFQISNRVQPVTISVERMFTKVTVHRETDRRDCFPWSDTLWFLFTPVTIYTVTLLPPLERHDDHEQVFIERIRSSIADSLKVDITELRWEDIIRGCRRARVDASARSPHLGPTDTSVDTMLLARRVKEVLPDVPIRDILRDLALTRNVDVTITNFLEGVTAYVPEPAGPSTASASVDTSSAAPSADARVTQTPQRTFPKSARERQTTFQERKAQMIAEARRKYIEKHGLDVSLLNTC